jgi:hypothetical protein
MNNPHYRPRLLPAIGILTLFIAAFYCHVHEAGNITSAGCAQEVDTGAPRLTLDKSELDFGVLDQECVTSRTIVLKNEGSALLRIKNINIPRMCTGLGCLKVVDCLLDKYDIAPGGSARLIVTLDSDRYDQQINCGFWITSNDPDHPKVDVSYRADVSPEVIVIPWKMTIRNLGARVVHRKVLVRNISGHRLEISRVETSSPAIGVVGFRHDGENIILDAAFDGKNLAANTSSNEIILRIAGAKPIRRTIPITIVRD